MHTATVQEVQPPINAATAAKQLQNFPPLGQETRSHVETRCAAFHLNRKPQTLFSWSCLGNGPIRPVRVNGRLAWATIDIKCLLNGESV